MSKVYDTNRVQKLAQISTKFHAAAAVGDRIRLGIDGDDQMPAKYRGSGSRPEGTIIRIKDEGTERSTLRVRMDNGHVTDLHSYSLAGDRVWEFTDDAWPNVLARNNPQAATESKFRGSGGDSNELATMSRQLHEMQQKFDRTVAEQQSFSHALVDSIAQITGEIQQTNPNAKFSKVFQEEYRGMSKQMKKESPFLSDIESDDDM